MFIQHNRLGGVLAEVCQFFHRAMSHYYTCNNIFRNGYNYSISHYLYNILTQIVCLQLKLCPVSLILCPVSLRLHPVSLRLCPVSLADYEPSRICLGLVQKLIVD